MPASAPKPFVDAYGPFTAGTEIKGYMNIGFVTSPSFQSRLVANFEQASRWIAVRDARGKAVFDSAATTDAKGQRIPDASDGLAPAEGETRYVKLSFPTNTIAGSLPIAARTTLHNRGGEIQFDLVNHLDVRAPLAGTVIKAGGLKIHVKAYPYEKGWLLHGAAAVSMEKFQDTIKPADLANLTDALFTWLTEQTIVAL